MRSNYLSVCILVKVVVLWVGTNNYGHTAEQVAGGILAIAQLLTSHLPKAKIVVLVSLSVFVGFFNGQGDAGRFSEDCFKESFLKMCKVLLTEASKTSEKERFVSLNCY